MKTKGILYPDDFQHITDSGNKIGTIFPLEHNSLMKTIGYYIFYIDNVCIFWYACY